MGIDNRPILFFGGTFNPPHFGHVNIISYVSELMAFEKIYIVPAFEPPHKQDPDLASFNDRFKMTQIIFDQLDNSDRIIVSDIEKNMPSPSYTYETLLLLGEKHPDSKIYPLLGMDMYLNLDQWRNYPELRKNFNFVVLRRKDMACPPVNPGDKVLDNPFWDIASNDIRDVIANYYKTGDAVLKEQIEKLISQEVFEYILKCRLYQSLA